MWVNQRSLGHVFKCPALGRTEMSHRPSIRFFGRRCCLKCPERKLRQPIGRSGLVASKLLSHTHTLYIICCFSSCFMAACRHVSLRLSSVFSLFLMDRSERKRRLLRRHGDKCHPCRRRARTCQRLHAAGHTSATRPCRQTAAAESLDSDPVDGRHDAAAGSGP